MSTTPDPQDSAADAGVPLPPVAPAGATEPLSIIPPPPVSDKPIADAAPVPPPPAVSEVPPPPPPAPQQSVAPPPPPAPPMAAPMAAAAAAVPVFPNGKLMVDAAGQPASPKSRLAAALLAFFFGTIGIHRFYVGKIGTGILMIVTLGGFGIWTLIDFIMILVGSFKDKQDRVLSNW
jgi:TM2 domain-containing membrane protein YozV